MHDLHGNPDEDYDEIEDDDYDEIEDDDESEFIPEPVFDDRAKRAYNQCMAAYSREIEEVLYGRFYETADSV